MLTIARLTQRLQTQWPARPLRGLYRVSRLLGKLLPPYAGVVTMPQGYRLWLDSRDPAERYMLLSGTYQAALAHVLMQHRVPGGYYLDVGANLGFYTVLFAWLAGKAGRVAAFEANPALVPLIERSALLNDDAPVEVVAKAVHYQSGLMLPFYVSASRGKSSLAGSGVAQNVVQVETITLDDYVQQAGWPRVDVLKLDVEGYDCIALQGAQKIIAAYRPFIVFEFTHTTDRSDQAAVAALLAANGYRLEILTLKGRRSPFDWRVPDGGHHVDVLAIPS